MFSRTVIRFPAVAQPRLGFSQLPRLARPIMTTGDGAAGGSVTSKKNLQSSTDTKGGLRNPKVLWVAGIGTMVAFLLASQLNTRLPNKVNPQRVDGTQDKVKPEDHLIKKSNA